MSKMFQRFCKISFPFFRCSKMRETFHFGRLKHTLQQNQMFKLKVHGKDGYVVVQFCPWFKFDFLKCLLGVVMYGNEFKTKGNQIYPKPRIC